MDTDQDHLEPKPRRRLPLPPSHPVPVEIVIDPMDWHRFEQLAEDTPAVRIIGHDDPQDGLMTVYVGCADHDVRERLEKAWA